MNSTGSFGGGSGGNRGGGGGGNRKPPFGGTRPGGFSGARPAGTGARPAGARPFTPRPPGSRPPGAGGSRPPGAGGFGGGGGFRGNRFRPREVEETHKINHRIIAREVRVIGDNGEQLGIMATRDAIARAESEGLDLVEVADTAVPPVCRIMDYGKFKYKEQKKEADSKKKRSESKLKELRLSYRTDTGDLDIKIKQAREFIAEGDKVKFTMRFKGREVMFLNLGAAKIREIIERMADVADVDDRSPLAGKQIHVTFVPGKGKAAKKEDGPPTPPATPKSGTPSTTPPASTTPKSGTPPEKV